jgi:hypothetical protein
MKDYTAVDGWTTYVPEFDGNREDDDPISAEILPLSVRESRVNAAKITAERVKGFRGKIRTNQAEISTEVFVKHVRNIRNLSVGGKPVTTAEELLDTNLLELVGEIEEAINNISILSEGDIKNFRLQSAGFPGKANGTAATAPATVPESGIAAGSTGETTGHR